jgi:hypothetical protein
MANGSQKLSVMEKAGYSLGDGAANFVFMSMILFQANFYTDVFGLSTGVAGAIVLVALRRAGAASVRGSCGLRSRGRSSWSSPTRRPTSASRP